MMTGVLHSTGARVAAVALAVCAGYAAAGIWLGEDVATVAPAPPVAGPGTGGYQPRGFGESLVWSGASASDQVALSAGWGELDDPREIENRLEHLRRLPSHSGRLVAEAALLLSWVEIDPDAACRWAERHGTGWTGSFAKTVTEWAKRDPQAALGYARGIADSDRANSAVQAVFTHLARSDPDRAAGILTSAPLQLGAYRPFSEGIRILAERDPRGTLEQAQQTQGGLRGLLRRHGASELAKADPAGGLEWWLAQPDRGEFTSEIFAELPKEMWRDALAVLYPDGDESEIRSAGPIGYNWAQEDPQALLEAVEAMPELSDGQRQEFLTYAVRGLSRSDPESALYLLSTLPGAQESLVGYLARRWGRSDLDAARQAVARIADAERRDAFESELGEFDRQPETAAEAPSPRTATAVLELATSGDSRAAHDFTSLPESERPAFFAALAALPQESVNRIAATFAHHLASSRPGDAAELLLLASTQAVEPPDDLLKKLAPFAAKWGSAAPAEAAAWAARLEEGSLRTAAAGNLARQWAFYDPAAAKSWAGSLPDEASRAAAIEAIEAVPGAGTGD